MSTELRRIKRALISVSNKDSVETVAKDLFRSGVEIISTGGTAEHLRSEGISTTDVSHITEFPELLDGRLKTLHPKIHGGILADRDDKDHIKSMNHYNIPEIDLVIVDLYPFEESFKSGSALADMIENIDIGGPTMIRAAAKNFKSVTVIVDTEDYSRLLKQMDEHDGCTDVSFRKSLAEIAFARTAEYDSKISNWFLTMSNTKFPRRIVTAGKLQKNLRYGENPHQHGSYYSSGESKNFFNAFELLQGKDLSYNNINDVTSALQILSDYGSCEEAVVAIIKHGAPCGVAIRLSALEAYNAAYDCDRMSAFGGIVALNSTVDGETASAIVKIFTEVIIAPNITAEARTVFSHKKAVRVLTYGEGGLETFTQKKYNQREVFGGFLLQETDTKKTLSKDLKIVSKRRPSETETKDMLFAWKLVKHVRSNAIVLAKDQKTLAIGGGQVSRLDSARIAKNKLSEALKSIGSDIDEVNGIVASSDAFFPFPDGVENLAEAGVTAIIQPGGSLNDSDVIEIANKLDIAMAFTGIRHFSH